ncbi:unnamed protein product, partial [Ectocarpus sp. 8 AP-2014]
MKYHGGKVQSGKRIAAIINKILNNNPDFGYFEPFCGMCSVATHVRAICTDRHKWISLRDGWLPPIKDFDEETYDRLRASPTSSACQGFFGHALSFGGIYFQQFRPEMMERLPRYVKDIQRIAKPLKNSIFIDSDYHKHVNFSQFVVFCDPPYEKRNQYYDETGKRRTFNSCVFWEWCLKTCRNNNIVVVVEN